MSKENTNKTEFLLPRLNIAVYGIGNHLSDIAGQLMVDRRLIESKISIFTGGISAAINNYKDNLTPDMLIIEINSDLSNLMNDLFKLSEVCDSNTKVVIAGQMNDIELYRELIRHGISDYLVLPTTATGLISVMSNIYRDKSNIPLAPSVAFIGALGGAGTSMIAQSVALNLANDYAMDTIFTDLDYAYPMTSLSWSVRTSKNIDTLIQSSQGYIDDAVVKSCLFKISNYLHLLTAPTNLLVNNDNNDADALSNIFKSVRRLSDFAIFDIPAGCLTVEKQMALLNMCHVAIVTEPTIKGIRNLSILYDVIVKLRPNDPAPFVIFNKTDCPEAIHLDNKDILENIGISPTMSIRYLQDIIEIAISRGDPVSSVGGSAQFNEDIQACTSLILGKKTSMLPKENPFFMSLKGIKRKIGL
jgi:pilus assembly protein CpaE